MAFTTNKNFTLGSTAWGNGKVQDIEKLLESVISDFYSNLDASLIPLRPVLIYNSSIRTPPINHPKIERHNDGTIIFLSSKDMFWCNYSYQFSHELCHYVIDADFPPHNDKFGWFEESLCELASIYTLKAMSITWLTNPPYENWKDYHKALDNFASDIISKPENNIKKPLSEWLTINMLDLESSRYLREKNSIVAVNLFPIFNENPNLWISIQYLIRIQVTNEMTFKQYLLIWKELIPNEIKYDFDKIINLFYPDNVD